jgi:hypothetical protein
MISAVPQIDCRVSHDGSQLFGRKREHLLVVESQLLAAFGKRQTLCRPAHRKPLAALDFTPRGEPGDELLVFGRSQALVQPIENLPQIAR